MGVGIELPLSVPGNGLTWVSLSAIDAVLPIENSPHAPSFMILLRGREEPLRVALSDDSDGGVIQRARSTKDLREGLIELLRHRV